MEQNLGGRERRAARGVSGPVSGRAAQREQRNGAPRRLRPHQGAPLRRCQLAAYPARSLHPTRCAVQGSDQQCSSGGDAAPTARCAATRSHHSTPSGGGLLPGGSFRHFLQSGLSHSTQMSSTSTGWSTVGSCCPFLDFFPLPLSMAACGPTPGCYRASDTPVGVGACCRPWQHCVVIWVDLGVGAAMGYAVKQASRCRFACDRGQAGSRLASSRQLEIPAARPLP